MFSAVRGARVYRAEAAREQERFLLPKAESNTRTYLPPRSVSFSIHPLPFRPDLPPSFYGALRRACLYLYPETYRSHGIISPLPFILFFPSFGRVEGVFLLSEELERGRNVEDPEVLSVAVSIAADDRTEFIHSPHPPAPPPPAISCARRKRPKPSVFLDVDCGRPVYVRALFFFRFILSFLLETFLQ